MENFDKEKHWQNIYQTKELSQVSWYQPIPETSLNFIEEYNIPKSAKIIDVGGGDSFFVDNLVNAGFTNVTVLDISEAALERAKNRLGEDATKVKWIVADASDFKTTEQYDFWHDRAAFHFLNTQREIESYTQNMANAVVTAGIAVIGTFSENGPKKCSGIDITQYSKEELTQQFSGLFENLYCFNIDHKTPFDTIQNFTFCSFRRK